MAAKKAKVELVCRQCGKTFLVNQSLKDKRVFCSRQCYISSHYTEAACLECGGQITYRTADKRTKRFCSFECFNNSRKKKVTRTCEQCGNMFLAALNQAENGDARFCSKKCANESRQMWVTLTCPVCWKDFRVKPFAIRKGAKYCSIECRAFGVNKNMFGYGEREDIPGIVFRSSWEANYARYLIYRENGNEISKWTYEPDIIDLGYARYIPDFKVFANGTTEYHEVKGYEREDGMLKIETALSLGYAIVLINEPIYKRIEKEYSGIIDNWEEC